MAEVLFYHLSDTPLERSLPELLEKSLQRGWRAVVKGGNAERLAFLDAALWTYRDDSFLPHGTENGEMQPVFLTTGAEIPNGAEILFLVDGATIPPAEMAGFARVCLMFDGNDPAMVEAARGEWKKVVAEKLAAKYWAREGGRWVQKAENSPQS